MEIIRCIRKRLAITLLLLGLFVLATMQSLAVAGATYHFRVPIYGVPTPALLALKKVAVFNRYADFQGGPSNYTTVDNPQPAQAYQDVWEETYVHGGGGAGSAGPWYEQAGVKLIWDPSWWGSAGVWARGNNLSPPIGKGGMTHDLSYYPYTPVLRWYNRVGNGVQVHVYGKYQVYWDGDVFPIAAIPAQVVIAKHSAASGAYRVLYSVTLNKPSDNGAAQTVSVSVNIPNTSMDLGDYLLLSIRAASAKSGNWQVLYDQNLNYAVYAQ